MGCKRGPRPSISQGRFGTATWMFQGLNQKRRLPDLQIHKDFNLKLNISYSYDRHANLATLTP